MTPRATKLLAFLAASAASSGIGFLVFERPTQPRPPEPMKSISIERPPAATPELDKDAPAAEILSSAKALLDIPHAQLPGYVAGAYRKTPHKWALDLNTRAALVRWAETDPAAATRWAESLDNQTHRRFALNEIGEVWAADSTDDYCAWLELHLASGIGNDKAISSGDANLALVRISRQQLAEAVRLVSEYPGLRASSLIAAQIRNAPLDREAIRALAAASAGIDTPSISSRGGGIDGAARSYSMQGGSSDRFSLQAAINERWRELDPEGYRDAVASGERDAKDIHPWGRNPKELAARLKADGAEFADAQLAVTQSSLERREVLFDIVSHWAHQDLDKAGQWLGELGNQPETWPARRAFSRQAVTTDPNAALRWMETIGDPKIREGAFVDMADTWVTKNGDAPVDTSSWAPEQQRAWVELVATARRP